MNGGGRGHGDGNNRGGCIGRGRGRSSVARDKLFYTHRGRSNTPTRLARILLAETIMQNQVNQKIQIIQVKRRNVFTKMSHKI